MKKLAVIIGGCILVLLILWMSGVFTAKIPSETPVLSETAMRPQGPQIKAQRKTVADYYEAVGTVRPFTETRVESQATGRVLQVNVRPGAKVKKGETLVVLDNREFKARLEQAQQALKSAEASYEQSEQGVTEAEASLKRTESTFSRMKKLMDQKAVTAEELEQSEMRYIQAEARLGKAEDGKDAARAGIRRAEKAVEEARISLGYTTVKAQEDGEVAQRNIEPGDMAFPGKPLLVLQTGQSLRLEAMVREGLISNVRRGDELDVRITALAPESGGEAMGVVEEVIPSADPATRTFLVKVGLPELPGLYPGMFGRLLVPMGEREVVLIPQNAVSTMGQLETVLIETDKGPQQVYVRTGQKHGDEIEILSGLNGDEIIYVNGDAHAG